MSRLLAFLQSLFAPRTTDGLLLFWAKEILGALIILALFWLLAQLITMALSKWGRNLTAFTKTDLDDRLLQRVIPSISLLLTILGLYLAIRSLPLHEKVIVLVSGALFIAIITIVCIVAYRVLNEFLTWHAERLPGQEGGLTRQMMPFAEKIAMLFIIGGALIVILKHFSYDIFSLVTALGIGSLAIGMAAKDTLAHVISGFTLMIDRPFRIGDRIQLTGGQLGDVADIGLRSTKIKTLDNQLLIIPNSDLCNTILINQAFPDARVKGRINLCIAYGSDVERVKELLVLIALEIEEVLRDPPPEAFFVSFGDSALNMSLFFWVDEYGQLFAVQDRINSLILLRFAECGIEIPYPTRTVRIEKTQLSLQS